MRKFLAPFVVTAAAALALSGCGKTEAPPQMPAPQVSVATPLQQKVVDWDDFTGRFEAPERVEVRARASGFLQAAHFREGQYVKKGQLLFTLDPRPAEAQLAAARAQARQAEADLARAESLLKIQAISREEYDVNWEFRSTYSPISGGVPEPATWAMMIVGFGMVGGLARRRGAVQRLA